MRNRANIIFAFMSAMVLAGVVAYTHSAHRRNVNEQGELFLDNIRNLDKILAESGHTLRLNWANSSLRKRALKSESGAAIDAIVTRLGSDGQEADRTIGLLRHTSESEITVETEFRNSIADVELANLLHDHPDFDTPSWRNSLNKRLEAVRQKTNQWQYVILGSGTAGTISRRQGLAQARIARIMSGDAGASLRDRSLIASESLKLVEELEYDLENAIPFPIINGRARGTIPPLGTLVLFKAEEQSRPATGKTWINTIPGRGQFKVLAASNGGDLFLRLLSKDGKDKTNVYLRSGEALSLSLAQGDYELRYARGTKWYGYEFLFGPDSNAHVVKTTVEVRDNMILTLELILQREGNISQSPVSFNEF